MCGNMEKSAFVFVFLYIILSISTTSGLQDIRKYQGGGGGGGGAERQRRGAEEEYHGAMWFGPRLGKRSGRLAADDSQTWSRLLQAADALKFYYSQLPYSSEDPEISLMKKVQFTPKQDRSGDSDQKKSLQGWIFRPRLGREAGDKRVTPADRDNFRSDSESAGSFNQPPLFSPRLGRTTVHFSPRFGRELYYDLSIPEEKSVRVVRNATEAKPAPAHST